MLRKGPNGKHELELVLCVYHFRFSFILFFTSTQSNKFLYNLIAILLAYMVMLFIMSLKDIVSQFVVLL